MTDREKIIVSAYTGVLMCDFNNLHKYIEDILGRPVFTHEMADKSVMDEIKEKSREEFLAICSTDTERNRVQAICEVAGVSEIDDLSDGYHTFRQLYYQRMMLFATIVKQNKDNAWKSLRHEDGELCFGGGWFIVGIDTPEGSYTYHYEDSYFSLFDCKELERSKHWDGHTEKDVTRLLSLPSTHPEWEELLVICDNCGHAIHVKNNEVI